MKKVFLFIAISFVRLSFGQIVTTDEDEQLLIKDMIEWISSDPCDIVVEDGGHFCCSSKLILGIFEKMMGLKTMGICDIYQTVCARLDCPAQTSQNCKPEVCPELNDEEKLLETEIKSGKYNDQELIDLVMFHILKEDELKVDSEEEREDPFLVDPNLKNGARQNLRAVAKILQKKHKL